jgi:non-ribosomal peptide synthetase component F
MENRSKIVELPFFADQYNKEREYWKNKLSGEWERTYFPYDFNKMEAGRPGTRTNTQAQTRMETAASFPPALYSKLLSAINGSDARLLMILIAGMVGLLHKYTENKDIIIGIPIEKQRDEGEYINTAFAIRNQVEDNMTFRELLIQVRQNVIEAADNQNYPLETIPHDLNMKASEIEAGDFPLFDISLLLENIHDKKYIQHIETNLVFSFLRANEHIECTAEYNSLVYQRKTIELIHKYFIHLLQELLFNADSQLSAISLLSKSEQRRLLYEFNKTDAVYPQEQTIQELFDRQVKNTPHRTVVKDENRYITYKELREKSEGLSCLLREKGINEETIAAIMGHRSIEMMVIILGILKSRGAYLPINAQDPADRIKYILKDSSAHLLITQQHVVDKNKDILTGMPPENILVIEALFPGAGKEFLPGRITGIRSYSKSTDPAYVIYTSGTTGKPKGVIIEQKSLVNYTLWASRCYVQEEKSDFPFYTSFSFDMSVTSIFTPLITGNAVVIYGGDEKEFLLEKVIEANRVEIAKYPLPI